MAMSGHSSVLPACISCTLQKKGTSMFVFFTADTTERTLSVRFCRVGCGVTPALSIGLSSSSIK